MNDEINFYKLEVHNTKDIRDQHENGSLTVVWRNWDEIIEHPIKMIYVSSINPGEIKGPHLHKKRNSYFTCIHGRVIFIIQDKTGSYIEIESSSEKPVMVLIPKGIPSAHVNLSDGPSRVLTLADVAWRPNDNEMENIQFSNYDWQKWSKYIKNNEY